MITPTKTASRDPTKSPSNKPSWFSNFLPSENPSRKALKSPITMPTVFQRPNPSGTSSHLTTQQPSGLPTLALLECQARKISTLLVVDQVITLVAVHQLLRVCTQVL